MEKINQIAIAIHESKNSVYGDNMPYSVHLNMVHDFFIKYKHNVKDNIDDVEKAIWFHDILEDCGLSYNDVKKIIGKEAVDLAYNVSNESGKNRKEKMFKTLLKTASTYNSIFIKLCDRLANSTFSLNEKINCNNSSMYDKYVEEYVVFRYMLRKNNWFLDMWDELDKIMNYSDYNHFIYIKKVESEILLLIDKRNVFYNTYLDSYNEETNKYSIPEPPEVDEIDTQIKNILEENCKLLSVDFIIESLTKLGESPNILYDDNGFFAITSEAFQSINCGDEPADMEMHFDISKEHWKKTIRDALIYYFSQK